MNHEYDQEEGNSLLERAYAADAEDAIDGDDEPCSIIIVPENLRENPFRVNAGKYRTVVDGNVRMREQVYEISEGFDTLEQALARFKECQVHAWSELQWINPKTGESYDVVLRPILDIDGEEDEAAETDAARQYGELP